MTNQQGITVMPSRAIIYMRFAKVDPVGHRVVAVRHMCEQRVRELGATVVAEYVDIGSRATGEWPQLTRMLDELVGADITYVVVPEHSMVARNMQDYARIVWKIEQAGARLIIASTPLENYPGMRSNPLGLQQAVADWANNKTHDGTREAGPSA